MQGTDLPDSESNYAGPAWPHRADRRPQVFTESAVLKQRNRAHLTSLIVLFLFLPELWPPNKWVRDGSRHV